MTDDTQAWQRADELHRMERAEELVRATEYRPLNDEERRFLAVEVGIGDIYKEYAK
jgi:hypothetical protein